MWASRGGSGAIRDHRHLLDAWWELSVGNLSGRCPHTRVGLPTDPEGKGTDSSWLMWTPSSPHFTLRLTTSATPIRQKSDPAPKPPSPKAKSSPSPSFFSDPATTEIYTLTLHDPLTRGST